MPFKDLGNVMVLVLLAALLCFVSYKFNLLGTVLFSTWFLPMSIAGSAMGLLIPKSVRLLFFLVLSMVGLTFFHGVHTLVVILLASIILNVSLLFSLWKTGLCFVLILIALVLGREGWLGELSDHVVYPVVGSFLIFRAALLLFERRQKHAWPQAPITLRMSYLMMLPNAAFLIFPPIGFQRFQNAYDPSFRPEVYIRGLIFLTRGVLNIVLYRVIYQYWAVAITDVGDINGLIRFMTGTYAIAFKISGVMNLAIGVLCLFGFDMPRVFNHFVLADSFSDLWRRINIYWRDLMVELFFNPLFFAFRGFNVTARLVFCTFLLFVITAILHAIQGYWLSGRVEPDSGDYIFWLGFGVLVSAEVFLDTTIKRRTGKSTSALVVGFRSLLVICAMSLLWTVWDLPSISMLGPVFLKARVIRAADLLQLSAFFFVLVTGTMVIRAIVENRKFKSMSTGRTAGMALIAMLCLWVGTMVIPAITNHRGSYVQFVERLIENPKNDHDRGEQYQGYYGQFFQTKASLGQQSGDHRSAPGRSPKVNRSASPFMTDSAILFSLPKPNLRLPDLETNSWGMRDKEYQLVKPDSTVRIAAVGASYLFGTLYEGEEIWEPILEQALNAHGPCDPWTRYEILNFGNGGYGVIPLLYMTKDRALKFNPDVMLLICHERPEHFAIFNLFQYFRMGVSLEDPYLKELILRAKVRPEMSERELHLRLYPFAEELVKWGYEQIASACLENGVMPVWVSFPTTGFTPEDMKKNILYRKMAEDAGFQLLEVWDIYDGVDVRTIRVNEEGDLHLNNAGHRLVADKLFERFTARPELLCN